MTENHKQKGVLERVFAVSPKGKGLLAASCIASVLGMVLSLVPYLSVYFICKYFLLGAAGEHGGIVLWTAVAGGAIIGNMVFTVLGSAGCHAVAFDALYRYRLYVMEHLGRISMGYFSTHTSGGIQKLMDENIEKMESLFSAAEIARLKNAASLLVANIADFICAYRARMQQFQKSTLCSTVAF